jgi:hypothetical protein
MLTIVFAIIISSYLSMLSVMYACPMYSPCAVPSARQQVLRFRLFVASFLVSSDISDTTSRQPVCSHEMADETAQLNDNASPDSMQTGARKRQKVTRACDACKSRKKRCTGDQPCAPCIKVRGKCTYEAQYNRGMSSTAQNSPVFYHACTRFRNHA